MKHNLALTIGFIGAGNMSTAGLKSLLDSGWLESNIRITSPSIQQKDYLTVKTQKQHYRLKIASNNNELIKQCDVIVLGFKPYQLNAALENITQPFENKIFISIMAGISINKISKLLNINTSNVMRLMPNTPCAIGQGIGAGFISTSNTVQPRIKKILQAVSLAFGCSIMLDKEEKLNAITAISGSGVAYVYLLCEYLLTYSVNKNILQQDALKILSSAFQIENNSTCENHLFEMFKKIMKQWAIDNDINETDSKLLVEQTFFGAYLLIKKTLNEECHNTNDLNNVIKVIESLRHKVTSKNGTTFAALEIFKQNNALQNIISKVMQLDNKTESKSSAPHILQKTIAKAMDAAYERAIEISLI